MLQRESGQTMAEYSIILAFVAMAAIAALIVLGPKVVALYESAIGTF